ncbi:MAG: c-type cytochrome, partial [Nitrospinaceae bacterium]|nr:cytochrome c [Nitrospinaceae bacterium]NIR55815.1 cytochrome c [Nitrospinaceae bacterium]NIS86268.1 cytochrome c [Nitrospinaceae bacterium]NIT83097.1 cytochrome c [Nitrospinaceae bacterium]NIU45307.1 cytochrome c [Nitrospinaceae bacterium]
PSRIAKMDKTGSANAAKGKALFQKKAKPMACAMCHGKTGKGDGPAGKSLKPAPRNFTCAATMKKISAGQMFWVIKNGPKGTGAKGMLPFKGLLSDKQIWDVIKYVRTELMK